jgi:spore maturation protein A
MLNIIWPLFIIVSFIYGLISGRIDEVNQSIFTSTESAVTLTINLLGTMCLWSGIMEVATKTTLISKFTNFLMPAIRWLFPEIRKEDKVNKEISLNIVANILGLGNAATPIGLKVMESLQKENKEKDTVNNSMAMFIIINTASLQLIPTTVIAVRSSLESSNPTQIIIPVWVATICAAIVGITVSKICIRRSK